MERWTKVTGCAVVSGCEVRDAKRVARGSRRSIHDEVDTNRVPVRGERVNTTIKRETSFLNTETTMTCPSGSRVSNRQH